MPTYNGWNVVTMPASPAAPASLEFSHVALVATTTNPFTGQQVVHDWQTSYKECSVSLIFLTNPEGQTWAAFLESLQGPASVFQFPTAVCNQYPNELMTGSPLAPRYWRLKGTTVKWQIQKNRYYSVTFEIREAI